MSGISPAMPTPRISGPRRLVERARCRAPARPGCAAPAAAPRCRARRFVRAATADSKVNGSCRGRPVIESPTQIECSRAFGTFGQRQQRRRLGSALHDLLAGRQQISDAHGHCGLSCSGGRTLALPHPLGRGIVNGTGVVGSASRRSRRFPPARSRVRARNSVLCSPSRGGGSRSSPGVAEKLTGIAVVTGGPSVGCSIRRKKPVSFR